MRSCRQSRAAVWRSWRRRTAPVAGASIRKMAPTGARSTCRGPTAAGYARTTSSARRCRRRRARRGSAGCCWASGRSRGPTPTPACTTFRPITRWASTSRVSASATRTGSSARGSSCRRWSRHRTPAASGRSTQARSSATTTFTLRHLASTTHTRRTRWCWRRCGARRSSTHRCSSPTAPPCHPSTSDRFTAPGSTPATPASRTPPRAAATCSASFGASRARRWR